MLNDFCEQYGYQEENESGDPNPISKKDFANGKINDYIVQTVNAVRKKREQGKAVFEELVLE